MRVVILGTGTNVGKTYVTAVIARTLIATHATLSLKPIESGVVAGEAGDAAVVASAAGHAPHLSRWRFERGVSPHLASRHAGREIDVTEVARWVTEQEALASAHVTLIETAGGAFSPLGVAATNVDLALALEPACWLLVAPDSLGVLHDLTATLRAMPRRPDAVVLSGARLDDASSGTNAAELQRLGICEVLDVVGRGSKVSRPIAEWLLRDQTFTSGIS